MPRARLYFFAAVVFTVSSPSVCILRLPTPPLSSPFFNNGSVISRRCASMYACSRNETQDIQQCSCHKLCSLFDTCCADVRPPDWRQVALPSHMYTCASSVPWSPYIYDFHLDYSFYTSNTGTFVINDCPTNSNYSSYLRSLCKHPLTEVSNDVVSVPISARANGLTYRNIFCAVCHDEDLSSVIEWTAVNLTIPEYYRGGATRIGFVRPHDFELHDCRRLLAPGVGCDACESFPTAYVYDSDNGTAYRNWHCSQCLAVPTVSCSYGAATYDYWWPPPTALPISIERGYLCSGRPASSDSLPPNEQALWLSRCPAPSPQPLLTSSPQPACDRYVDAGELARLFVVRANAEHGVAPLYAWLRFNSSGTAAAVICTACTARRYAAASTQQEQRRSGETSNGSDSVTIGDTLYCRPFFELQADSDGYVVVCGVGEQATSRSRSIREGTSSAAAITSATLCPSMSRDGGVVLELPFAKYLLTNAGADTRDQFSLAAHLLMAFVGASHFFLST